MRNLRILLALAAAAAMVLMAAGCDEHLEASEENFTRIINEALSKRHAVIPAPGVPLQDHGAGTVIEDLEVTLGRGMTPEERRRFRRQMTYAKLLQSTGMAAIDHGAYTERRGSQDVELTGYLISYNDRYSSDIKHFSDGKIGLIAGFVGVEKIMRFSEPKTEEGETFSNVTYTRTIVGRPEWVTDAVIDYSGIKNYIRGQQTIRLVLREKGWEVGSFDRRGQDEHSGGRTRKGGSRRFG